MGPRFLDGGLARDLPVERVAVLAAGCPLDRKLGLSRVFIGIVVEVLQLIGGKEPAPAVRMQLGELLTVQRVAVDDRWSEIDGQISKCPQ